MFDTSIIELLERSSKPLLSLEFFPPKNHKGFGILGSSIERMRIIRPDFVTITYGAGGSTRELSPVVGEVLRKMGFSPIIAPSRTPRYEPYRPGEDHRRDVRPGLPQHHGHSRRSAPGKRRSVRFERVQVCV